MTYSESAQFERIRQQFKDNKVRWVRQQPCWDRDENIRGIKPLASRRLLFFRRALK